MIMRGEWVFVQWILSGRKWSMRNCASGALNMWYACVYDRITVFHFNSNLKHKKFLCNDYNHVTLILIAYAHASISYARQWCVQISLDRAFIPKKSKNYAEGKWHDECIDVNSKITSFSMMNSRTRMSLFFLIKRYPPWAMP